MARGFPHRMRFKAFNARYRMLANPITRLSRAEEKAVEDCEIILDCYSRSVKEQDSSVYQNTTNNKDWAHGRKHVFLSEGARQQLENMRELRRQSASRMIQKAWRRWHSRRTSFEIPRHQTVPHFGASIALKATGQRPRPQPISGTPPPCNDPLMVDKCDFKTIQQTCSLFGLDLVKDD
jgi:dachs protein